MRIVASKEINSDANIIKQKVDKFSEDLLKIQDILNSIPLFWQGTDSEAFINKYNEAIVYLRSYETSLYAYFMFLSELYKIFSALDEAYNKKINVD